MTPTTPQQLLNSPENPFSPLENNLAGIYNPKTLGNFKQHL